MKSPSLRLGSLPEIRVSAGTLVTLLVLSLVIHPVLVSGGVVGPGGAVALALVISVFMIVSVLVHELAHALSARAFGASVDHIALTLWGGHTQYRAERMGGLPSILISLAGPASNLALAALALGIASLLGPGTVAAVFWGYSAWLNIALAVFNLLPGLPMDGGRALEALLGSVLRSRVTGTRVTAWIGRVIAAAVVVWPLQRIARSEDLQLGTGSLLMLVWALVIAGMLWQGASRALEAANLEHRIQHLDAAALSRPVTVVGPDLPLSALDRPGGTADRAELLVLDESVSPPRAYRLDPAAAASVPAAQREHTPVLAVAGSLGEVGELPAGLTGSAVVTAMLARPRPLYLVREADGEVRGVIMSADVNTVLRGR